jgi:hypothetical protein
MGRLGGVYEYQIVLRRGRELIRYDCQARYHRHNCKNVLLVTHKHLFTLYEAVEIVQGFHQCR